MTVSQCQPTFDAVRPARVEDLDALLATVNLIHRVMKNRTTHIAADFPHVFNRGNAGNSLIVTAGGRVASSVSLWANEIQLGPARLKVGGINCLATLPECRRRGLGEQVMRAAHERMRQLGCHVGLLGTGIVNWYRRLGWECAGTSLTYRFDRGNIGLLPALSAGMRTRVCGEEALAEVVRLRAEDRLGGVRDAMSFREIYIARGAPKVVLAERAGRARAYLLARDRQVSEWAGPARLVAGLLRAWYESNDDPKTSTSARDAAGPVLQDTLTLTAPGQGHGLMKRLRRLGIPAGAGYAGMIFLLDPRGVLDAFGLGDIACSATDDTLTLQRGAERCVLSRCLATKLFFGPESVSDFARKVFPLPFWQWPIEHV